MLGSPLVYPIAIRDIPVKAIYITIARVDNNSLEKQSFFSKKFVGGKHCLIHFSIIIIVLRSTIVYGSVPYDAHLH